MRYGMKKGTELGSSAKSISTSVHTDWANGWSIPKVQGLGKLSWKGECILTSLEKKNSRVSPCFYIRKFLKQP
jgi:hypothetical protein